MAKITLFSAAVEQDGKDTIIRGRVIPESLPALRLDPRYQREKVRQDHRSKIREALRAGNRPPPLEIGMRGISYSLKDSIATLEDPCYVIDGQQRVDAALQLLAEGVRKGLGATVYLNTTWKWEADRFDVLGTGQLKLSPNTLIRNAQRYSEAVKALYELTQQPTSPLYTRVTWTHYKAKSNLLSAATLLKTMGALHGHETIGTATQVNRLVKQTDDIAAVFGLDGLLENTTNFFEVMDKCWGMRNITNRNQATHLQVSFLWAVAQLFSRHVNFWKNNRLWVEYTLWQKIKSLDINERTIVSLASTSGAARSHLLSILIDHVNSGKRQHKLTPRS